MRNVWELPDDLDPHPPALEGEERASVADARGVLDAELAALRERFPPVGALLLTGHAHLDLAWRWPLAETRRKARRTLSTAVELLARHPELTFNQSAAQVYAFLEEDDPALLARLGELAAEGRLEPIGGMWVEPDCVMPAGESLVRQLLYGQRAFRARFGAEHTVCWLPDCFGFTPALPQLLRGAGIERFFTIKLSLVGDQPLPARPVLVGGAGRLTRAGPPLRQPGRRLQRRRRAARRARARGATTAAARSTRRACSRSATATAAGGRPGDDRAGARAGRLPGPARPALRPRGRVLRSGGGSVAERGAAGLGRRALPRAAPRGR